MSKNIAVDIIIPIYNAYDDLLKCIASVKKWTDLGRNRLILINDCSSDEKIRPYLDTLKEENIIVIHNEKNKGFSANINIGMNQSDKNDVLLLNSDTVVTKNWIEKIVRCAYSDLAIATVTPLSNNATLCSVPVFCAENQIPEGYTIDSYAELIETVSLREYPRIPVAHGFCMFIKREVIEKIGLFDEETFGRGYGEENDFCHRAEQIGYYHAMCDDTFILHTGTSSFLSEEKRKYIEEHGKVIEERYPEQSYNTEVYCRDNPNRWVIDNIKLYMGFINGKKNILYLLQSDFREGASDNIGGTQLHVKDLVSGLKDIFNVYVAARDGSYLNVTAYIGKNEKLFRFYLDDNTRYHQFRDKSLGELFGKILDSFCIHLVHIHHVMGLSFEIYYQANERNIPIVVTLHDYYYVCPTIKLLDTNNEYCINNTNEIKCRECLSKKCGISERTPYLAVWRRECEQVLRKAQTVIVPSKATKEIVLRYYPCLRDNLQVIQHGSEQIGRQKITHEHEGFRVAFVGGISKEKGSLVSSELVKSSSDDIAWYLFGKYGYNELSCIKRKNFIKTGEYQREELPGLLEKYEIDLVCILSICPETFCYTLSEAVACGIPVITTDIGALKERMEQLNCGWIVPYQSTAKDIMAIINRIKGKGDEYQTKLKQAENAKIQTVEDMCLEYKEIYEKTQVVNRNQGVDYRWVLNGYLLANDRVGVGGVMNSEMFYHMRNVENELQEIKNSFNYRAMRALDKIKLPFKEQVAQCLYAIYRKMK